MTQSSLDRPSNRDDRLDLAVVFVHGIGSQARGSTLLNWVEPLVELLDGMTDENRLASRIAAVRDLAGDHPEVELEIRDHCLARQTVWLMLEARWAESFHPSSASEVLKWAFGFGIRAASRVLDMLVRQVWIAFRWRLWQRARDEYGLDWRSPLRLIFLLGMVALTFGFLVSGFLLPLLIAMALLMLGALALPVLLAVVIPFLLLAQRVPFAGARVSSLVSGLVTSIGDAQAFRSRAIQAAAMRDVLLDRLAEARRRARKVVVVAHSQGAAISIRTLLEEQAKGRPWPDLLITLGAGITLLNRHTSVDRWANMSNAEWVNVWTLLDPVPAGPIGQGPAESRARMTEAMWHQTGGALEIRTSPEGGLCLAWSPGPRPAGTWSGQPSLVEQVRSESPDRLTCFRAQSVAAKVLDRSSSHFILQIVPATSPRLSKGPEEWPVANRLSLARDHVTYSRNLTQVQYAIARRLLALSDGAQLPELPALVLDNHIRRVRALFASRLMAVTSAVAILAMLNDAGRLDVLAAGFGQLERHWGSGWVLQAIPELLVSFLLAGATVLFLATALSGAASAAWTAWHHQASLRACCSGAEGSTLGIAGWLFVGAHVLMTLFSAVWFLNAVDFQSSVDYPMTHTMTETLVHHFVAFGVVGCFCFAVAFPFVGLRPRHLPARRTANSPE